MHVIIIPPVDMLPKGMLTYSYNTCQLVPSSMLTCMSPTTCMSTLLHMSTYSLTMLTCSIKYVNMLKQVCQHAFHSQHACQEFSTCQHTAPFPDVFIPLVLGPLNSLKLWSTYPPQRYSMFDSGKNNKQHNHQHLRAPWNCIANHNRVCGAVGSALD